MRRKAMTIYIAWFRACPEQELMFALLAWQDITIGINPEKYTKGMCMKDSGGKGTPCAYLHGKLIAKGFFELVDWLKKEGHILL
jgi:hypothetical protein